MTPFTRSVGGPELELAQQCSQRYGHLHVGEGGPDAAPDAAAIGDPGMGVRIGAEEPIRVEGAASVKLRSDRCARAMLTMIAWFSGITHSPSLIRYRVTRNVASMTGRVR